MWIPFFRSATGLVRRCIGNAAPSFLTTQLSLVVLAPYMRSRVTGIRRRSRRLMLRP